MMSHKAFAFDWRAFDSELHPLMTDALATGDTAGLLRFLEVNCVQCTDPYDGNPLPEGWKDLLTEDDVQELSDYALTRYYRVAADYGLGEEWMRIDASLPPEVRIALLGKSVGPAANPFDPGKMGSFFQNEDAVAESIVRLTPYDFEGGLMPFLNLLQSVAESRRGVYVTF